VITGRTLSNAALVQGLTFFTSWDRVPAGLRWRRALILSTAADPTAPLDAMAEGLRMVEEAEGSVEKGGSMSQVLTEVLRANAEYAAGFGDKRTLALPPARRFAILTCMDARLDPAKFAGLQEGDAHVIRNAGGRASDDAIRSLVISPVREPVSSWSG
jgi:hypothetical protein